MRITTSHAVGLICRAILAALAVPGVAAAYLSDTKVYPPINYAILVPPDMGGTYLDPAFGTRIKRISDAPHTPSSADAGPVPFITHEYATMSPFNVDNSRMVILHHSYFALYDGAGNYLQDLPFEVSEPRWSRHSPDVFYYLSGNALKQYDVVTGKGTPIRTFGEYSRITGLWESDVSFDGDHLVLAGDGRYIFVYTLSTDTQSPALDTGGVGTTDFVQITPDNNVVVAWAQSGNARRNGLELYDGNMNFLRQLAPVIGHLDVARDLNGEEIALWANAASLDGSADCRNGVVKIRLADGVRTCLLSLDWSLALHISAPDRGDWFAVSTYAPGDPAPVAEPGGWARYTNEILLVKLDGSAVRRLAHHRSRPLNDYWYTPRAAMSQDGTRVLYASNYGLPTILEYPPYYSDAYLIDVAAARPAFAGSTEPPAARVEQNDAAVSASGAWFTNVTERHSGGSAMLAMNAGDRLDFTFDGTVVSWTGYRDRWAGTAFVYLDGMFRAEVDTYAAADEAQAGLYTIGGLALGTHTLTIEATGRSNPASDGAWIWADAFDAVRRVEHDADAAHYRGTWYSLSASSLSGGSVALAMNAEDQVNFTSDGTAISWIGYRDRWAGIAQVFLNGVLRAEIDTYASVDEAQARLYTLSGLPPGTHTLSIRATGRKNPASGGAWIWVDAFETPP